MKSIIKRNIIKQSIIRAVFTNSRVTGLIFVVMLGILLGILLGIKATKAQEIKTQAQEMKALTLVEISKDESIRIDGRLDEKTWSQAEWSEGFTERTPKPQAKPAFQGGVKALFDGESLYVGVRLDLAPNEIPSVLELRRDQMKIWSDDTVTLKIDARLDQRTTLGLVLNCGGAQLDFLALDNGQGFYVEFDTLWEGASSIGEQAWFAEYRIPLSSLGLSQKAVEQGEIGFNVTRDHNARQATDDWQHLPPEFGPFSALHYGKLKGLKNAKSGRPFIVIPYGLSRLSNDFSGAIVRLDEPKILGGTSSFQMGGELRLSISQAEWIEATILTDFAQVDLDDPLINLDRFPLFLPERRPYFINGLDIFAFGARGRSQAFFSRRIGLTDQGTEVPVLGGVKVYGRRGAWRYGVLSAYTGESQRSDEASASQSFVVSRARYDIGQGGYLGLIAMTRNDDEQNIAGGLDGRIRLIDTRLELSGFYSSTNRLSTAEQHVNLSSEMNDEMMSTLEEEKAQLGHSAGMTLSWRGQNLRPRLDYLWIDEKFDPVMGFVYRKDIHSLTTNLPYYFFRPYKNIRSAMLGLNASHDRSSDWNTNLGYSGSVVASICHDMNICLESGFLSATDEVRDAFDLAGIARIQAKRYETQSGYVMLSSPSGKRLELNGSYTRTNGYFDGHLDQFQLSASVALNRHLRLLSLLNWADFEVYARPIGQEQMELQMISGDAQGISGQVIITPNPNFLFDTVAQLNSDREQMIVQSRIRYRYRAGSDLYLVYRWQGDFSAKEQALAQTQSSPDEWRVTLKFNWRFDFLF